MKKADKYAFKELFRKFPPQNLVLSNRIKPDTPPPTPEQRSALPDGPQCPSVQDPMSPSCLTPPVTPSPSPQDKIMLKLILKEPVKKAAKKKVVLDYVKVKRRSKRLSQQGV